MEYQVFQAIGMTAGIGGVALGVLLFVLRDIIKKNIFPKFKDERHAYRLLRLIVISVWTVAILGIGAWLITSLASTGLSGAITINNNDYSSPMQFSDYDVIVNQYQEIHAEPLGDAVRDQLQQAINLLKGGDYKSATEAFEQIAEKVNVPAVHNNLGGLLALQNDPERARRQYSFAIAQDPEFAPVQLNLGLLEERAGNYSAAEKHLGKADLPQARELVRTMVERSAAGSVEQEPNDDRFRPNIAPLNEWIDAAIAGQQDNDYYQITTPDVSRDIVRIELENQNLALKPRIGVYDADKKWLHGTTDYSGNVTAGQNMEHQFSATPGTVYLVWVASLGDAGPYRLRVSSTNAYDQYEPNEVLLNARPVSADSVLAANIMDSVDQDYFQITVSEGSSIGVDLQNKSPSYKPRIGVYDPIRKWVGGTTDYSGNVTAGQDMQFSFNADTGGPYYVWVGSLGGRGNYILTIKER